MNLSRSILESVRAAESFSSQKKRFVAMGANPKHVDEYFRLFKELKKRGLLGPDERDIDRYGELSEVQDVVDRGESRVTRSEVRRIKKSTGAEKLYEDANYAVYWIKSPDTAITYGKGTHWCIASKEHGPEHFAKYVYEDGQTIYYMLPKEGRFVRRFEEGEWREYSIDKWAIVANQDGTVHFWDWEDHNTSPEKVAEKVRSIVLDQEEIFQPRMPALPDPKKSSHQVLLKVLSRYRLGRNWATYHDEFIDWVREVERRFLESPGAAYKYATLILKKRWPEGEKVILEDPNYIYNYAHTMMGERWPEGEQAMLKAMTPYPRNGELASVMELYAENVMGERWPEAEWYIRKDNRSWSFYSSAFDIDDDEPSGYRERRAVELFNKDVSDFLSQNGFRFDRSLIGGRVVRKVFTSHSNPKWGGNDVRADVVYETSSPERTDKADVSIIVLYTDNGRVASATSASELTNAVLKLNTNYGEL